MRTPSPYLPPDYRALFFSSAFKERRHELVAGLRNTPWFAVTLTEWDPYQTQTGSYEPSWAFPLEFYLYWRPLPSGVISIRSQHAYEYSRCPIHCKVSLYEPDEIASISVAGE